MSDETHDMINETKGLAWRVSLSILVGVGWLVFLIVWLFFFAKKYAWEKNVAIFLVSLLFLIGILGVPWTYWALKKQTAVEKEMWKVKGFRWRVGGFNNRRIWCYVLLDFLVLGPRRTL